MRGAAGEGMKIAARGEGEERGKRIEEREAEREREHQGKGDERKGRRKTENVWREQRGVAR